MKHKISVVAVLLLLVFFVQPELFADQASDLREQQLFFQSQENIDLTEIDGAITLTSYQSRSQQSLQNNILLAEFDVATQQHVTITIYNIRSEKVATLLNEQRAPGQYKLIWNALDRA